MDDEQKRQRIVEAQAYIVSGEFARGKRAEQEDEVEEDTSYRVKGDSERSAKVLADFLGGKMFDREEGSDERG